MRLYEIRNVVIDLDKLCYVEPVYTSRGKHLILNFGSGNLELNFNDFQQADNVFEKLIHVWKQGQSIIRSPEAFYFPVNDKQINYLDIESIKIMKDIYY